MTLKWSDPAATWAQPYGAWTGIEGAAALAPPVIVGLATETGIVSGAAATVHLPAHVRGDLLIVIAAIRDPTSLGFDLVASTSGSNSDVWTNAVTNRCAYVPLGSGNTSHNLYVWWAIATSFGTSTMELNRSTGSFARAVAIASLVVTGFKESAPINATATGCGGPSSTLEIPSLTTTVDNCLCIHAAQVADMNFGSTVASVSGWHDGMMDDFGELFDYQETSNNHNLVVASSGALGRAGATGPVGATATIATRYLGYAPFAIAPGRRSRWKVGRAGFRSR